MPSFFSVTGPLLILFDLSPFRMETVWSINYHIYNWTSFAYLYVFRDERKKDGELSECHTQCKFEIDTLVNWSSNAKRVTLLRCDLYDPTEMARAFSCKLAKLVAQIGHHDTSRFHYYTWICCHQLLHFCSAFWFKYFLWACFVVINYIHSFGSIEETTKNGTRSNVKCSKMKPTLCSTEGIQRLQLFWLWNISSERFNVHLRWLSELKLVRLQGFMLYANHFITFSILFLSLSSIELFGRNPSFFGTFKSIFIGNVQFSLNEIAHTWSTFSIYTERESFVLVEC